MKKLRIPIILLLAIFAAGGVAMAQEPAAASPPVDMNAVLQRIAEQQAAMEELQRLIEQQQQQAAFEPAPAVETPATAPAPEPELELILPPLDSESAQSMQQAETQISVGIIEETMLDEDNEDNSQGVSSTLILSNDVFFDTASYQLSQFFFRVRGYENRYDKTYLNGIEFNEAYRGVFNYASVGALNDFTRNGDVSLYSTASDFAFTGIGGAENINLRASAQQRGSKLTVSLTNRNYYARAMYTYSTGLMDNGWAFTGSVGGRYSHEGFTPGVFYRNFAAAVSVEKQLDGGRHSFSLATFISPVQRGQASASYQEAYDLVGSNLYNPNWGWLNGKKRNSRIVTAYDPTAILTHDFKISDNTSLSTSLSYHYGRYGNTALAWYGGSDPRPDYYRNLPSWQKAMMDQAATPDEYAAAEETYNEYLDAWGNKDPRFTQVNWYALYYANFLSVQRVDGGDGSSIYMLEERRSDIAEAAFNSVLNSRLSENTLFTAGVSYKNSVSHQFKTVADLMGGEFITDYDVFSKRDQLGSDKEDNDLNNPGRKAYTGDVFGYDFKLHISNARLWMQNRHTLPHWDIYYGASAAQVSVQREGFMRNGRFADNSFGKGQARTFYEWGAKFGTNWKISGRHIIALNATAYSEAPAMDKVYISPRVQDGLSVEPETGKIASVDLSYIFSMPKLQGRLSLYHTRFFDMRERYGYYNDSQQTFTNHLLTDVDRMHQGIEAGIIYSLDDHWSFEFAGAVGDYRYTNNPMGTLSLENGTAPDKSEMVYLKNLRVGSTPQMAGTLGVNFFHSYWFVNASVNAIAYNYVGLAPIHRMMSRYTGFDPEDPDYVMFVEGLVMQEHYKPSVTIDLSVGKIIYLRNRDQININLTVNNLANNRNIRTGGYEQGRMDTEMANVGKFPSKFYYMQGINAYLNIGFRF